MWLSNNAPPVKFQYARLQTRAGRTDIAGEMLAELRKTHPNDPGLLDLEGSIALAARRPRDAIAPYQRLFADYPASIHLLKLARAKQEAGLEAEAVRDVEAWLEKTPKDLLARVTLGDLFLASRQFEKAVPLYLEAIRQIPNNVAVLNNLAWSMARIGRSADAVEHARKAAALAPDNASVLDTYGMVLTDSGRFREAVDILRSALQRAPLDADIQFHLAQALVKDGDTAAARGHPAADPRQPQPDHGACGGRASAQADRRLTSRPDWRQPPAGAVPIYWLFFVKVFLGILERNGPGPAAVNPSPGWTGHARIGAATESCYASRPGQEAATGSPEHCRTCLPRRAA